MLEVNGKSIIQRQRDVLSSLGINEIIVVTGYQAEIIKQNYPQLKYVHDNGYKVPGILKGLFCAEKEMDGGFILAWSDVVFSQDIIKRLLEAPGDIVLTVSTNWQRNYKDRQKHPINQAQVVKVEDGRIIKAGRAKEVIKIGEAHGEFIGLTKFTDNGVEIIKEVYHDLLKKYKKEEPFQNAQEFQMAYLTDFIQELVDRSIEVRTTDISSIWSEIDTDEDLERARKIWK